MVHTTSAQVRLAKLDRQIAELQAERAKITGEKEVAPKEATDDPINRVVLAMQMAGSVSSEELQRQTELSKQTVMKVIKSLLGSGTVTKTGQKRGTRYVLVCSPTPLQVACDKLQRQLQVEKEPEQPKRRVRVNPDVIVAIVTKRLGGGPMTMKDLIATTALDKGRLSKSVGCTGDCRSDQ